MVTGETLGSVFAEKKHLMVLEQLDVLTFKTDLFSVQDTPYWSSRFEPSTDVDSKLRLSYNTEAFVVHSPALTSVGLEQITRISSLVSLHLNTRSFSWASFSLAFVQLTISDTGGL